MSLHDLFVPFPAAQREAALHAYAAHLAARDGTPDAARRLLPHREDTLTRLTQDCGRYKGRIDPDVFTAYVQAMAHPTTSGAPPASRELLFVYTCVRANTYEAYSVEKLMANAAALPQATLRERMNLTIMLEEDYHTKFLRNIAEVFGVTVGAFPQPPWVVRALIAALGHLPQWVAHPLTLCSEIMGLALFVKLLDLAGTLFAGDAALREAIEIRLGEVIADELGHISYNRLHLTSAGLALAWRMLPLVAYGARYGMPGTEALGLYPFPYTAVSDLQLGRLPARILDQAFLV